MLAHRGEMCASRAAFEAAATAAARRGYRCLEAVSVRELLYYVTMDDDGAASQGSRLGDLIDALPAVDEAKLDELCHFNEVR